MQELTVEKLKELDNNSDGILEISDFLNCIPDSTSISFSLYLLILGTDKEGNMKFNEELDPEGKGRFSIIDNWIPLADEIVISIEKNQMHSNAGNQTRNSYTVVYIFGDNENEIRDVLIEKLSASNISCKRVGGQEIIERCHEDINVKKKYIIAFSEMASLCITKASELLGENIIINRIFLINPSKAKESDLYLGDISIIDGNSVAIKSWEKAVLGNVREFESNSNDIFDIIMRELENDK